MLPETEEVGVLCSCCVLVAAPLVVSGGGNCAVTVIVENMIVLLLFIQQSSVYFIYVKSFDLHSEVDTVINSVLQTKRLRYREGTYFAKDTQLVSGRDRMQTQSPKPMLLALGHPAFLSATVVDKTKDNNNNNDSENLHGP